jgi:lysozyme
MKRSTRIASVVLAVSTAFSGLTAAVVTLGGPSASAQSTFRCHFTSAQPEIKEGSTGVAVKQAQCELNFAWEDQFDHLLAQDGKFGPLTRTATIQFQRCSGLAQDGIIGPQTWSQLNLWTNGGVACNTTTVPTSHR